MLALVMAAGAVAARFGSHLGGYTGDSLGAVQQVAELAFLFGVVARLT